MPWLVRVPGEEDLARSRAISQQQMMQLEEVWMRNPAAGLEDIGCVGASASMTINRALHDPRPGFSGRRRHSSVQRCVLCLLKRSQKGESTGPEKVCIKYEDAYHYQNIYGPLLKLEADYDKTIAENQR